MVEDLTPYDPQYGDFAFGRWGSDQAGAPASGSGFDWRSLIGALRPGPDDGSAPPYPTTPNGFMRSPGQLIQPHPGDQRFSVDPSWLETILQRIRAHAGALAAPAGPGQPSRPVTPTPGLMPNPGQSGIGSDANMPLMGAGGFPTTYAAPGQQPAPFAAPPAAAVVSPPHRPATPTPAATATAAPAASRAPQNINLGYYRPTGGNARGQTWTPYTNPNDPRIYRG